MQYMVTINGTKKNFFWDKEGAFEAMVVAKKAGKNVTIEISDALGDIVKVINY